MDCTQLLFNQKNDDTSHDINSIDEMSRKIGIEGLYYITHFNNVASILERGILSHSQIEKNQIQNTSIYNTQIIDRRANRIIAENQSLWDFANLYFQPRNAMLYSLIYKAKDAINEIAILGIKTTILSSKKKIFIATGNAASQESEIISMPIVEPQRFFQPVWRKQLTNTKIFLVKGDLFFSRMQTLTISVNCVGVMGKGLASTAKYRFPDVYVKYEDLCKRKTLKLGQPYIYKRESSAIDDLYDESFAIADLDDSSQTWFLLFPTKDHWRNKSTLAGIEQGLQWLQKTYKNQEIKSLAIPALGCGLGGLSWEDVGPLMCKYLISLDIPVALYLPTESELPEQFLSNDFLLSQIDF